MPTMKGDGPKPGYYSKAQGQVVSYPGPYTPFKKMGLVTIWHSAQPCDFTVWNVG